MSVKFTDNSDDFFKELERGVSEGMKKGAVLLEANIRKETPVVTGNLRAGTEAQKLTKKTGSGQTIKVENNVEYARHVEYGTDKFAPRAMFRKGGDASVEGVQNELIKALPK